jgi:hypothetical protein
VGVGVLVAGRVPKGAVGGHQKPKHVGVVDVAVGIGGVGVAVGVQVAATGVTGVAVGVSGVGVRVDVGVGVGVGSTGLLPSWNADMWPS